MCQHQPRCPEWHASDRLAARIVADQPGRAEENRAYVRMLLRQRQPAFAAALASAERYVSCPACSCRRPDRDGGRARAWSGSVLRTHRLPAAGDEPGAGLNA
jgi:hypothetical protein